MESIEELSIYSMVLMTDVKTGAVLFEEHESPHSKLASYISTHLAYLQTTHVDLYVNQLGLVIANLAPLLTINHLSTKVISKPAQERLTDLGIPYTKDALVIDLIYSSKNPDKVCSLEKSFVGLNNREALNKLDVTLTN